jgi:hypothetical protein
MGGSIKEDILFWKPGQQERIFFKYWTAFWHQMDFGGQDVFVSVLMTQQSWQGDIVEW